MSQVNDRSPLEEKLNELTVTEAKILADIAEFKNTDGETFDRLHDAIDFPFDKLTQALESTSLSEPIGKLVEGVLMKLNEALAETVPTDAVIENFREEGHRVESLDDVKALTIDDSTRLVKTVSRKYEVLAVGEGIVTGAVGLPGAFIDLPMLIGLSLRAALETAAYFGYDPADSFERRFAVLILALASASTDDSKQRLIEALDSITHGENRKAKGPPSQLSQQVAQALVLRLVRGKFAQTIPVVGAVVGGGYNRSFVADVCETAIRLYQQRWLNDRHLGDDRTA